MSAEAYVAARNAVFSWGYRTVAKPLFFRMDPETAHDRISAGGAFVGRTALGRGLLSAAFGYADPMLETTVAGINFKNPIGLAAGFDKNALLLRVLPEIGFGFAEIGSVTAEPCPGNPPPHLYRLKDSQALIVYYGLMNDGADAVAARFKALGPTEFPFGLSVAPFNGPQNDDLDHAIADYCAGYRKLADLGAYVTLNVSCPNTCSDMPFMQPKVLDDLLAEIGTMRNGTPVFLKLNPDITLKQLDGIMEVAVRHGVTGLITGNLTKDRESEAIKETDLPLPGGISGLPTQKLSERLIAHVAREGGGKLVSIGCGGTFTAEDAYRKIRLGASLVQMVTGMIYGGPQTISAINQGLVRLLKRDGFTNIMEAVGADLG